MWKRVNRLVMTLFLTASAMYVLSSTLPYPTLANPPLLNTLRQVNALANELAGTSPFTPTWNIQTVDNSRDLYQETSLALDSNGHPHISYHDWDQRDLHYVYWNGTAWISQTLDTAGTVGENSSLVLDSNDWPHISYQNYTNDELKYASWNGNIWDIEIVTGSGMPAYYGTSLALDGNEWPHISYDRFLSDDLNYAHWNGSSWTIESLDTVGVVGRYSSLALDSNDQPHISYYDGANDVVKYIYWTGSSWISQTVSTAGAFGGYTSLELDSNDQPHISYVDSAFDNVNYAYWSGSSWIIEIVDSVGDVEGETSLALDNNNWPHISYYAFTNVSSLSYAHWNGNNWEIELVETGINGGRYSSLALDAGGRPHISYNISQGPLKYAHLGASTIIPISGGELNVTGIGTFTFPSGAFPEAVKVSYTPLEGVYSARNIGIVYELNAVSVATGNSVNLVPNQAYSVVLNYDETTLPPGLQENTLRLYRYVGGDPGILPLFSPFLSVLGSSWTIDGAMIVIAEDDQLTGQVERTGIFGVFGDYRVYLPGITIGIGR